MAGGVEASPHISTIPKPPAPVPILSGGDLGGKTIKFLKFNQILPNLNDGNANLNAVNAHLNERNRNLNGIKANLNDRNTNLNAVNTYRNDRNANRNPVKAYLN